MQRFLNFIASLKLTLLTLVAAMVLVLAGTLAQFDSDIHEVQRHYFQSLFVWWPISRQTSLPIFPGGHLILGILIVNLIAAHIRRFRWAWNKIGIQLIHLGLILLLASCLITDFRAVESFVRLHPGESKNYSEDQRAVELSLAQEPDTGNGQSAIIPEERLKPGTRITLPNIPFDIVIQKFFRNARITPLTPSDQQSAAASTHGVGATVALTEMPPHQSTTLRDLESVVLEVIPHQSTATPGTLGTWLLCDHPGGTEHFVDGGNAWSMELRPRRYPLSCSLTLLQFIHERFTGTEIARQFASHINLLDPEHHENRDVTITMNHPLRYRGKTFYQSGFETDDSATILQVVENPVFFAPYLACAIIAAGLCLQFIVSFHTFSHRRKNPRLT